MSDVQTVPVKRSTSAADQPVNQPGLDEKSITGEVTRITGPSAELRRRVDPIADMPVVQGDPNVTVTRIRGNLTLDGQGEIVNVDVPADTEGAPMPLHGPTMADRPVTVAPEGVTGKEAEKYDPITHLVQTMSPQQLRDLHSALGKVVQADPEVEVTRVEGDDTKDGSFEPRAEVKYADKPLPEDHPTGVVTLETPAIAISKEQAAAYRQDQPYKADRTLTPEEVQTQRQQLADALGVADDEGFVDPHLRAVAAETATAPAPAAETNEAEVLDAATGESSSTSELAKKVPGTGKPAGSTKRQGKSQSSKTDVSEDEPDL